MPTYFQTVQYIKYWLTAVDQHSLHSPFLFKFYNDVILSQTKHSKFKQIENWRADFIRDHRIINTKDLGASKYSSRKISQIARKSLSTPRFGRFLFNTCRFLKPRTILELGTSLGISTLYLAGSHPEARVITIEGCPEISEIANNLFKRSGWDNIDLLNGDIQDLLPEIAQQASPIDLFFIDANHSYSPTNMYFDMCRTHSSPGGVGIVHDIHSSNSMNRAWGEIKENPSVGISCDVYQAGVLFLSKNSQKQDYILQF